MNVELLNPNDLEYIQSRVDKHEDKIEEYKDLMADGHEFGACQGIRDASGKVLIYDGYHRGEAVKRLGGRMLLVDVMNGDRDLAEWLSLSSNTTHGIPRSTADKAKVVMAALQSPMAVAMSNRQIAHHCGVDESTIRNYRKKLESANNAEIPQADKSKTNGTTPSPAALPLMPIPVDTTRKLSPAEVEQAVSLAIAPPDTARKIVYFDCSLFCPKCGHDQVLKSKARQYNNEVQCADCGCHHKANDWLVNPPQKRYCLHCGAMKCQEEWKGNSKVHCDECGTWERPGRWWLNEPMDTTRKLTPAEVEQAVALTISPKLIVRYCPHCGEGSNIIQDPQKYREMECEKCRASLPNWGDWLKDNPIRYCWRCGAMKLQAEWKGNSKVHCEECGTWERPKNWLTEPLRLDIPTAPAVAAMSGIAEFQHAELSDSADGENERIEEAESEPAAEAKTDPIYCPKCGGTTYKPTSSKGDYLECNTCHTYEYRSTWLTKKPLQLEDFETVLTAQEHQILTLCLSKIDEYVTRYPGTHLEGYRMKRELLDNLAKEPPQRTNGQHQKSYCPKCDHEQLVDRTMLKVNCSQCGRVLHGQYDWLTEPPSADQIQDEKRRDARMASGLADHLKSFIDKADDNALLIINSLLVSRNGLNYKMKS